MQGVVRREKRYVAVDAHFDTDGHLVPRAVIWEDGQRYNIDAVLAIRRAASLRTGGDGMRYTIRVGTTITHLYFEDPRWFVEERIYETPT